MLARMILRARIDHFGLDQAAFAGNDGGGGDGFGDSQWTARVFGGGVGGAGHLAVWAWGALPLRRNRP